MCLTAFKLATHQRSQDQNQTVPCHVGLRTGCPLWRWWWDRPPWKLNPLTDKKTKTLCAEKKLLPSQLSSTNKTRSEDSLKTGLAITRYTGPPEVSAAQCLPERVWSKCWWIFTPPFSSRFHRAHKPTPPTETFPSKTCRKPKCEEVSTTRGGFPSPQEAVWKLGRIRFQRKKKSSRRGRVAWRICWQIVKSPSLIQECSDWHYMVSPYERGPGNSVQMQAPSVLSAKLAQHSHLAKPRIQTSSSWTNGVTPHEISNSGPI